MKKIIIYFSLFSLIIQIINPIPIIKGTKILLSSSKTIIIKDNTCEEIIIPSNYKKLNIQLDSTNISKLTLTDIPIEKCEDDINFDCCSLNSTFCMKNINPTNNYFNLKYCLDYSYLYVCGKENSHISISINVIKDEGCQVADFSDEAECATLGVKNCKSEEFCNSNCQYIECLKKDNNKLFSMCLPTNYSITQIMRRCSFHIDFDIDGKFTYKKCTHINKFEDNSSHKLFKIFVIIFGMGILVIFMLSVFYRFKTSMDYRAPFNPPWFCPNFIFPRANLNL